MLRSIPRVSPETNEARERCNAHEPLTQGKDHPMPQAQSHLSPSHPSVEQVAGAINAMIVERAQERLRKPPAAEAPAKTPPARAPSAPGVYFGLSSADYHADPSLGSSDIKRLLRSPSDYWWESHLNPDRPPDKDTPAMQKGRALHKLVLEGEEAFESAFISEPQPAAYPGALVTLDDLKAKCRELGEPISGTKSDLAKRIKAKDPAAIIWDEILATFRALAIGLETMKADAMREVRQAAASITLNPHLARAFQGGIPEVSVFWVDEYGIACKCRLDWLKPRTIVDLKKCTNVRERPFDLAVMLAIAEYRYDISARHYLDGYAYLYEFAAEGRIFGECPLKPGWHQRIMPPDEMRWTWVFHATEGAPVTKGLELLPGSSALNRAAREIVQAKRIYVDCLEKYGERQWISDAPIAALNDTDLPAWMREDVEEYA
jgi:PDDEXK-like domain of unknown function (DUF3799)/SAP domain